MFGWFRRWRDRAARRRIERLLAENRALKAQWRDQRGDEPFPTTPAERRKLKALRDRVGCDELRAMGDDGFFGPCDQEPLK